jgi:hypothetical protein
MNGIIFWNCNCVSLQVRNLEKAWRCERSVLGTYLGVLERMATNILDSWSEEEVIDPAHLASPPSSANQSSTSLGKPEAARETCYYEHRCRKI